MRNKDEILNCKRMIVSVSTDHGCSGRIILPRWSGSFVCGYDENGWEHVSVSPFKRNITPSWDDMCMVKDIFWKDDEAAIQIHPKKSEYVNVMENCLHIWRKKNMELPT